MLPLRELMGLWPVALAQRKGSLPEVLERHPQVDSPSNGSLVARGCCWALGMGSSRGSPEMERASCSDWEFEGMATHSAGSFPAVILKAVVSFVVQVRSSPVAMGSLTGSLVAAVMVAESG